MGIKGLLQLLPEAMTQMANLRELSGQVAAIDAYGWMHRGAFSCGDKIYLKEEGADAFVKFVINNCNYLLDQGIIPVVVFDGRKLPAKRETTLKRRELREKTYAEVDKLFKQGKEREARYKLRTSVHVTEEMAMQVQAALRERCIRYVVAPYEADAQMVHLVNIGVADFALSEDADLILFGCKRILFKFDRTKESGVMFDRERIRPRYQDLTHLRRLCIISGCDYLPNLAGVGLKKAEKFMDSVGKGKSDEDFRRHLKRLPSVLNMNIRITEDYIDGFFEAHYTFLHQLVYCPKKMAMVPLNEYPEGYSHENFAFAGELLEVDLARLMAFGNVDLGTLQVRENRFDLDDNWLINARHTISEMLEAKAQLASQLSRSSSQSSNLSSNSSRGSQASNGSDKKRKKKSDPTLDAFKKLCSSSAYDKGDYDNGSPVSSQLSSLSKYFKKSNGGDANGSSQGTEKANSDDDVQFLADYL